MRKLIDLELYHNNYKITSLSITVVKLLITVLSKEQKFIGDYFVVLKVKE